MSKEIQNYFEMVDVCRKASSYFVGSFMIELLMRRAEWENPKTKMAFIQDFHNNYFAWDEDWSIDVTRNKVNCVIRIIESGYTKKALEYVLRANDKKLLIPQAKINAEETLAMIASGEIKVELRD